MTAHMLDPRAIPEHAFPRDGAPAVQWQFLLHYAVLAPSIYNTQPWHFQIHDEVLDLYLDPARTLPIVDPQQCQAVISCGAVLANLQIALRHFGYGGQVALLPDPTQPDLLARVQMGPLRLATELDHLLFQSIPRRHTDRQPFTAQPIPSTLFPTLQAVAGREDAWLQTVSGATERGTGDTGRHGGATVVGRPGLSCRARPLCPPAHRQSYLLALWCRSHLVRPNDRDRAAADDL